MRCILSFLLFFAVFPVYSQVISSNEIDKNERDEVVGLFGTILAPSIFSSAKAEKLSFSVYGRSITGEGEVPDFDGDVKEKIDSLQVFINARMGGLGATVGFGQGNEFEFSQPLIVSVDYKLTIPELLPIIDAAIDAQYSMIYLPKEKIIKVSAPGFGTASINGIVSANLLFILEPYAGVTFNYVYLDSEDEFIKIWKTVPKLGLKLKILPVVNIGTELSFVDNKYINSSWIWNIGATARF